MQAGLFHNIAPHDIEVGASGKLPGPGVIDVRAHAVDCEQNAICRKVGCPDGVREECVDCPLGICDTKGIGFGARVSNEYLFVRRATEGRRLPLQQEIEEIREIVPDIEEDHGLGVKSLRRKVCVCEVVAQRRARRAERINSHAPGWNES